MITLDEGQCVACGTCVMICHNRCVTLVGDVPSIDRKRCDRCTQCIAVCPRQALSWDGVPPSPFDASRLPSPEQLEELFKERRSIRFFEDRPLDRTVLEQIVACGILAPTNNHALEAIVVDDAQLIEALERATIRFNTRVYRLFFKPRIVFQILRRIVPAVDHQVKQKLQERRLERFRPAAIVFIVGDRRKPFSEASAQAALDHLTLYALARGVGSCLWGAGQAILDRNKAARARLGLRRREHILGVLLLGYPAVRFVNKVKGRTMPTRWIAA